MAISISNIGKKNNSTATFNNKKYIGYSAFQVLAINPTTEKLQEMYGRDDIQAKDYVRKVTVQTSQGEKEVNQIMLQVYVKPYILGDNAPIMSFTMFVVNHAQCNKDFTKVQVIDKYGRTAWVTTEQFKNKQIPMYANGKPANIDADYRMCYRGEEQLMDFIKKFMNVPNVMKFNAIDRSWSLIDTPEIAECRLDTFDAIFKGDLTEINNLVEVNTNGSIGLLIGIKRNPETGALYHAVYTHMFPYVRFDGSLTEKGEQNLVIDLEQNGERYKDTEFKVQPLAEYVEVPGSIPVNTDTPADPSSDVFVTPTATSSPFDNTAAEADELPF